DRGVVAISGAVGQVIVAQGVEIDAGNQLAQNGPAVGPPQGERGQRFGDVLDAGVEAESHVLEPAEVGIGGRDAEMVFGQAGDGAVVDHLPILVAPRRVDNLPYTKIGDAAGDQAV